MAVPAYVTPRLFVGTGQPHPENLAARRSRFGDVTVVLFLLTQCWDGVFTYVGVTVYGAGIEANPLLLALMSAFGHGAALTGAKVVAALLGIFLHLRQAHSAVGLLAAFYVAVALGPWTAILFF